jgi:ankyrin repeat protein
MALNSVSYAALKQIVNSSSNSVEDLLRFRSQNTDFQSIVDISTEIWARVFRNEDIMKAFRLGNEYVANMALQVKGVYNGMTQTQRTRFNLPFGLPIGTFDFPTYFISGDYPKMDDWFIRNGFANSVDARGNTSLATAVEREQVDRVRFLLEHGENPDLNDPRITFHRRPMYLACCCGGETDAPEKILNLLIENGADINITNSGARENLLMIAEYHAFPILMRTPGFNLNYVDAFQRNVLHYMQDFIEDFLPELVRRGVNIDHQDNTGDTILKRLLVERADKKARKIASTFLAYGADPNVPDVDGKTAIFEVMNNLDGENEQRLIDIELATLSELLLYGADPQHRDNEGRTIFFYPWNYEAFTILFDAMTPEEAKTLVNVIETNEDNFNTLYIAYRSNKFDVASLLIRKGASPYGRAPSGLPYIFDLADKLAKPNTDYNESHAYRLFFELIKYGALDRINIGRNLLVYCGDNIQTLRLVLQKAQEDNIRLINQQDLNGNTPLMNAMINGHLNAIEVLIDYNADPNLKNQANQRASQLGGVEAQAVLSQAIKRMDN